MSTPEQSKEQTKDTAIERVLNTELVGSFSQQYKVDKRTLFSTLMRTVFPRDREGKVTATVEQFVMCISVAQSYNLNPFTRQIYFFPSKGGAVVPIVPVDGWVNLANRNKELDGFRFEYEYSQDTDTAGKQRKRIEAITCFIKRKGMSEWCSVREKLSECVRDTDVWKNMPERMLRHKAFIQCARLVFGLSGLYDEDEAYDIIRNEGSNGNSAPEIQMPRRVQSETSEPPLTPRSYTQEPISEEQLKPTDIPSHSQDDLTKEYLAVAAEIRVLDTAWQTPADVDLKLGATTEQVEAARDRLKALQALRKVQSVDPKTATIEEMVTGQKSETSQPELIPPTEEPKKLKKDMTTAEQLLGPVERRPKPSKVLSGEYEKVKPMHLKKLHVILNSAKVHTEKELYEKIWLSWGIESTKDIPRDSFDKVLSWCGGDKFKIKD